MEAGTRGGKHRAQGSEKLLTPREASRCTPVAASRQRQRTETPRRSCFLSALQGWQQSPSWSSLLGNMTLGHAVCPRHADTLQSHHTQMGEGNFFLTPLTVHQASPISRLQTNTSYQIGSSIRLEIKCSVCVMSLNHPETNPCPLVCETNCLPRNVPGAKKG